MGQGSMEAISKGRTPDNHIIYADDTAPVSAASRHDGLYKDLVGVAVLLEKDAHAGEAWAWHAWSPALHCDVVWAEASLFDHSVIAWDDDVRMLAYIASLGVQEHLSH